MILTEFQNNYSLLLQYMEDNQYCPKYIAYIKTEINWILTHNNDKWKSLKDACEERLSLLNESTHNSTRAIFTVIERFILTGQFPDGKRHGSVISKSSYDQLTLDGEFKQMIDFYKSFASKRKAHKTIISEVSSISTFFLSIEKLNKFHLSDITENDVLFYFKPSEGKTRGYGCKTQIDTVLLACGNQGFPECIRLRTFLPKLKNRRKNIQYLTEEELTVLKKVLYDTENCLKYRDRAIGLLLIFNGIRAIDISKLELSSIDWRHSVISFIQDKTNQPVEIPMNAVTGNMIFDYLTKERPESPSKRLFLPSSRHNKGDLSANAILDIVDRFFFIAGIRQECGDRRGSHLFRHHLASSLLENNVPQPVITSTLGHTSPESLDVYIQADFKHLRECGLEIDRFPIGNEVFHS